MIFYFSSARARTAAMTFKKPLRSTFKCALMFANLTSSSSSSEPDFITAIPDLLDQDPPESLREELEARGVEREAFVMDDLCPAGNLTKAEKIKGLKGAFKRANARCYAFVSAFYLHNGC